MRTTRQATRRSPSHRAGRRPTGPGWSAARPDDEARRRERSVRALRARSWRSRWTGRVGGRRYRALRRALAVALLVLAGISAVRPDPSASGSTAVTLTRDLPVGAALTAADVTLRPVDAPPDGALTDAAAVTGRRLTSAARRGEVLTDRRLVDTPGPEPGPGRAAVAVRPADPAVLQLLQAGTAVAVVGVTPDGEVATLSEDGLVLAVLDADAGSGRDARPVLLSVPVADADRLAGAALTGDIAVRLR